MTMLKRLSAVFIVASMVAVLGCAATQSKPQTTEAYMGDAWVTTQVKNKILNEPSLKVTQINVETYQSVVQLSGFADSGADIAKAADVARAVPGVRSVRNDMRLK